MNPVIGQQKQSGGYKFPSPSKTAKRSSNARKPSGALAGAAGAAGASGAAQPELHRIMSLFQ